MSYADQKMSNGRIAAIVIVALLHAIIGYAFITGLAYQVIKKTAEDLKTFDVVEEPPPPEEEPPPPPPDVQPVQPPPVVSPPPLVRTNTPAPIIQTVRTAPPAPITFTAPPAPPAPVVAPPPPPPPPPPPRVSQAAKARGSLPGLIDGETDYPDAARRAGDEGAVRVRLAIGTDGRVTNCTVSSSSGSSSLDSATCRILRSRARFTPARDQAGNPIADTVNAPPIRWQLLDD